MDSQRTPNSRIFSVGSGRVVHAREWEGRGRPVVLLPGMFDSSSGWDDLARAGDRACLAIDLAGFGRSSPPNQPRLSAYAEDVVRVLRQAGLESITLVGHSLGGGVATAVAERMPDRVAALVLLAPVGFGRIATAELGALPLVRALAARSARHVVSNPSVLRRVYTNLVTRGVRPTEELGIRLAAEAAGVGPGLRAAVQAIATAGHSPAAFHRRLVHYGGPVVAVWGDRDAIVPPSHRRGVAAALPQARMQIWRGMGHHPQRERPHELANLVADACFEGSPGAVGLRTTKRERGIDSEPSRTPSLPGPAAGALEAA